MTELLGYLGYALIVLWTPIQIIHMLRGSNVELGRFPLVTLALGLGCLQVSFGLDRLPLYAQIGNGMSLSFTMQMLAIVSWRKWQEAGRGFRTPVVVFDLTERIGYEHDPRA